ncbi:MAG: glycosyltransferase family A protein [Cyanobacteria bacterium P01_D01_bin.116]
MLVFVIALKSPKLSTSWKQVSQLFERTIKSICNQKCQDFQIVVACHEKPITEFHHPKIHYLEVDLPIPNNDTASKEGDKARKLLKGLAYAEKFSPSHVMIVDADDCISKHIVEHVKQNPDSPGWFVKKGYVYREGEKLVYLRSKAFSSLCGSGIIIKYGLHYQLFKGDYYDHKVTQLKDNINLEPLPFSGAMYIAQHGENLYLNNSRNSKQKSQLRSKGYIYVLRDLLQYRLLTGKIRKEFNLFDISS